ncbi:O-antigen polymerase [Pseudogulbenkiania sp. NH8B]|uniref:O-antigen ligase family protein n=1 Tax=Pseudogulbenkiania sp. (strain NH8B) TaxID=748280 RepID=UPI000227A7B9|nr:O-antigen ligase family protein [Pseudogulbenkiania sp. NH8B]BAK78445.1 O-antigen polymerase [Pseudogulbenkiania sp. NH8B]
MTSFFSVSRDGGRLGVYQGDLTPILLAIYVFAAATTGLTAVMNIAFWLAVLTFFWQRLSKRKPWAISTGPVPYAMLAMTMVFFLSLAVNPAWLSNNLHEFWKDHVRNLLVFLMALSSIRSMQALRPLLMAAVAGFTVRALLLLGLYWGDFQALLPYRKGFALDATFLFTITAALFLFDKGLPRYLRLVLGGALLVQAVPLMLHGSRTPLLAIAAGLIVAAVLGRYWKWLFTGLLVVVVGLVGMAQAHPDLVTRYASPFSEQTYQQDSSFLERRGIWFVTSSLIREHPLLGYGPGWRKLAPLARSEGYIEKLAGSGERQDMLAHDYFRDKGYGKANPHNLYLQVVFETGLLGLSVYLVFLSCTLWCAIRLWGTRIQDNTTLSLTAVALLVCYLITGFANGLWAGSVMLLLIAAVLANQACTMGAAGDSA